MGEIPSYGLCRPVGDVLVCPRVPVLLGQAEVDDVHQVPLLPQTPGQACNHSYYTLGHTVF